jgi:hypothetical protein
VTALPPGRTGPARLKMAAYRKTKEIRWFSEVSDGRSPCGCTVGVAVRSWCVCVSLVRVLVVRVLGLGCARDLCASEV